MMPRMSRRVACSLLCGSLLVSACSDSHKSSGSGGTGSNATGSGGKSAASGSTGTFSTGSSTGQSGTGGGGPHIIYADTDDTLFTLDPTDPTLAITTVGKIDCIGPSGTPGQQSTAMTDLAVDKSQNIWGLSSYAVRPLTIQNGMVHCGTEVYVHVPDPNSTNPSFPYIKFEALTFAPEGVIKPNEVLVAGDTAGELWSIEPPGTISQHGQFGTVPADDGHGHAYQYPGKLWELSGDIVFLANNGNPVGFATVRDCMNPPDNTNCDPIDTLIEIDMSALAQQGTQNVTKSIRGQIVKSPSCGDTSGGYGSMYGIASWNDKVFGFSRSGNLVEISNVDGSACLVKNYPMDLFSGAAVTTVAPVIPPPM